MCIDNLNKLKGKNERKIKILKPEFYNLIAQNAAKKNYKIKIAK